LLIEPDGLPQLSQTGVGLAEVAEGIALAAAVVDLRDNDELLLMESDGRLDPAQVGIGASGLGCPLAEAVPVRRERSDHPEGRQSCGAGREALVAGRLLGANRSAGKGPEAWEDRSNGWAAPRHLGDRDLLIAAIALAHDLTLVTHNTGEFSRVPRLRMEDWAEG
jgi:hypothetical protein